MTTQKDKTDAAVEAGKSWIEKYLPIMLLTLTTSGVAGFITTVSSLNKEILVQQGIINDMQRELNGAESDIDDLQKRIEVITDAFNQKIESEKYEMNSRLIHLEDKSNIVLKK